MHRWEKKDGICGIECLHPNICWTPKLVTEPDLCFPPGLDPDNPPLVVAMHHNAFVAFFALLAVSCLATGILVAILGARLAKYCRRICGRRQSLRRWPDSIRQSMRRWQGSIRQSFRRRRQSTAAPSNSANPPINAVPAHQSGGALCKIVQKSRFQFAVQLELPLLPGVFCPEGLPLSTMCRVLHLWLPAFPLSIVNFGNLWSGS